jgi:hypothetical protein
MANKRPGRKPRIRPGATCFVRVKGDRDGGKLLAEVERVGPYMVRIVEADPIWASCRLNERQFDFVSQPKARTA